MKSLLIADTTREEREQMGISTVCATAAVPAC